MMTNNLNGGSTGAIVSPVRTLFLTRNLPYPPMGGGALRNWQNINSMMKFGAVAVFAVLLNEPRPSTAPPPGIAIWSLHHTTDEIKRYSWREKIERNLQQPWWLRNRLFVQADLYYSDSIARELEQVLTEFQPQLVVFEELWLYHYLPVVKRRGCRIIYDAHNAESFLHREVNQAKVVKGLRAKLQKQLTIARVTWMESNLVRQAEQVWVCSDRDADLLQDQSQKTPNYIVANAVDLAYYDNVRLGTHSLPSQWQPKPFTLIFTARFSYIPNILAAQLLLEQIYPQLQQVYPQCRLLLVGADPTPTMQQAAEKDQGIIVTGKVADIRPYLAAASTAIVPLFQGGGTRLKILEAFAAGLPVVSTTKGAEGLRAQAGKQLLIGDSPEELVAGVCQLWSDNSLAEKLARTAYDLVKTEYSWEMVDQRVGQAIAQFVRN